VRVLVSNVAAEVDMRRRPSVLLVSIALHAVVLIVIASADLWRPITDWPTPRTAIAFLDNTRVVRLDDVPLPPTRGMARRSDSTPNRPVIGDPAPLVEPEGVSNALSGENVSRDVCACIPGGVADGVPGPAFGIPEMPPPPPSPPPQPGKPIRLHSGVKPPQRLVNVAPVYPSVALAVHKEGIVIIDATIDEQGNVTETRILRSIPLLDEAALAAVRQWRFSPTLLNGVPVSIVMTVTVNFKMNP
jgi:TonB family protein